MVTACDKVMIVSRRKKSPSSIPSFQRNPINS